MADWDLVNTDAVEWIQEHDFDLIYAGIEITPEQNDLLRKEMANFVGIAGYNLGKVTKQLEHVFGPEKAEAIARTEATRVHSEGNIAKWKREGVTVGKEWDTRNDLLVCEICRELQDQVVPLDQLFLGRYNGPPAHEGCRCSISPKVEGDTQTGAEIRKEYGWSLAWEEEEEEKP